MEDMKRMIYIGRWKDQFTVHEKGMNIQSCTSLNKKEEIGKETDSNDFKSNKSESKEYLFFKVERGVDAYQ